jgi:uncharacterized protein YwqG
MIKSRRVFMNNFNDMGDILEKIKLLGKNEITILADECDEVSRPDESKIGGNPYLPSDFSWPVLTYEDDSTVPLSFFCQINLDDVAEYDVDGVLPRHGMLYFFYECESSSWGYDPEDRDCARVYYYEDTSGFSPFDPPEDIAEEYLIPEIKISFRRKVSYPSFEEFSESNGCPLDFEEYYDVLRSLGAELDSDSEHKLLGYADIIQNEMLTDCERINRDLYCGDFESYAETPVDILAEINASRDEWTLLLQLGTISCDAFEWMFGDCGILYFYIKKGDLEKRKFEKTIFFVQCM